MRPQKAAFHFLLLVINIGLFLVGGAVLKVSPVLCQDSLVISQFYPIAAAPGKTITIKGTGFGGQNFQVFFGGAARLPAANVTVLSSTQVEVVVPETNKTHNPNGYLTIRAGNVETTSKTLPTNTTNPGNGSASFAEFVLVGDVNGDGVVDATDSFLARDLYRRSSGITVRQKLAVDVVPLNFNGSRGDGTFSASDLMLIRAASLGQVKW
ncbi:MAG: IPT/TIG domain-containing protein [Blastocatellia bacterium]|nr:IPT/TIG domain-containing protein [Blastocatellia bacterium]